MSSAYFISIGNPSCTSVVGVAGNCGRTCWRTISKAVVNTTGLKLSPLWDLYIRLKRPAHYIFDMHTDFGVGQ